MCFCMFNLFAYVHNTGVRVLLFCVCDFLLHTHTSYLTDKTARTTDNLDNKVDLRRKFDLIWQWDLGFLNNHSSAIFLLQFFHFFSQTLLLEALTVLHSQNNLIYHNPHILRGENKTNYIYPITTPEKRFESFVVYLSIFILCYFKPLTTIFQREILYF